jgi:uncharacterized membrane protein YadS
MSKYALVFAMAAIGTKITLQSVLKDGKKALFVGSVIFIFQIIFSYVGIWWFL